MNKTRCILILFVLLGLGVSLTVPAEDVPETAYDESEALPYEGALPFSTLAPQQESARTAKTGSLLRSISVMKRFQLRRENNTVSERIPDSITILDRSFRC